ncbi:MAG: PAS domain S-box protein [bacterium]|nr:PAS domain S-box protein [bacterium]
MLAFSPAAERMFGFKAAEIIGHNISLLMPSPHAENHDGYLNNYLTTGKKNIIGIGREVAARKKNGTLFPVELSVGVLTRHDERLFTGFLRDLTTHRLSENQIADLQSKLIQLARHSAMGELATTLAHELNQPLTAIANYTLATRKLVTDLKPGEQTDTVLKLLDKSAKQAQRAGEIIRSIRTFVKHHENKFRWENLEDAVCEAVKIATIGTGNRPINVHINKPDPVPDICMDRIQIQQVVTNLVRNAVDAVRVKNGEHVINIEISRHGMRSVIVRVLDNGPGITPQIEKRLFESFNTSKPDGVGVGLAISKTIITSHNGYIRGRNRAQGGAEFYFILPIDSKAEEISS